MSTILTPKLCTTQVLMNIHLTTLHSALRTSAQTISISSYFIAFRRILRNAQQSASDIVIHINVRRTGPTIERCLYLISFKLGGQSLHRLKWESINTHVSFTSLQWSSICKSLINNDANALLVLGKLLINQLLRSVRKGGSVKVNFSPGLVTFCISQSICTVCGIARRTWQ